MAFRDIRMPNRICEEFQGGPTFATSLVRARSGYVQANVDRPDPIFVYEGSSFLKDDHLRLQLVAFYMALEGMGNTFRFRDMGHYWFGCQPYRGGDIVPLDPADIAPFATGTGTQHAFQLMVPYTFASYTTLRKITKPATVSADNPGYTGPRIWVESGNATGIFNLVDPSDYDFDFATGIVTIHSAPVNGARIKWAGLFDVHGRWQDDQLTLVLIESPEAANMKLRVIEELSA